jgi:hypothetical protein
MQAIETLILDLEDEGLIAKLTVEPTPGGFTAKLVDGEDGTILCDRHGDRFLNAFGCTAGEAVQLLDQMCQIG